MLLDWGGLNDATKRESKKTTAALIVLVVLVLVLQVASTRTLVLVAFSSTNGLQLPGVAGPKTNSLPLESARSLLEKNRVLQVLVRLPPAWLYTRRPKTVMLLLRSNTKHQMADLHYWRTSVNNATAGVPESRHWHEIAFDVFFRRRGNDGF